MTMTITEKIPPGARAGNEDVRRGELSDRRPGLGGS